MRALAAVSLCALVLLLAPVAASAADAQLPCPDQIDALCPDTEPNSPARRQCVGKNAARLSEECRRKLGHAPAKPAGTSFVQPLLDACKQDQPRIAKLCTDSTKLLACLNEHKSELGADCQKMIERYSAAPAPKPAKTN